jgi:endonuclease/exonuclease/phosphatase (EEP) superfamily protein YafD
MAESLNNRSADEPPASYISNVVVRLCVLCGLLASLATLLSFGARYHWVLDLFVNMRSQLALGLTLATVPLLFYRNWRHVLVFTICLLVNLADVVPLYLSPTVDPATGQMRELTVLSGNVLSSNGNKRGYLDYLRKQKADLVLLLEVDPAWAEAASQLSDEYPYQIVSPRRDNFGLALFSRYELVDARVDLTLGLPTIVADVKIDGSRITFIGTHPLPPVGAERFEIRNTQLSALATRIQKLEHPVVLCGDLNTTPWSPAFKELLARGGLRDARVGFGLQSTWPAIPWPIAIPIDHILVSPQLTVTKFSAGPLIGSDHRPVQAKILIPTP